MGTLGHSAQMYSSVDGAPAGRTEFTNVARGAKDA
jgi:hypothetical protein